MQNEKNMQKFQGKRKQNHFLRQISKSALGTLTIYDFKMNLQNRLIRIWFYFSIFYGMLMLLINVGITAIYGFTSLINYFCNFGTLIAFITGASSIAGEIGGVADTVLSKSVRRWEYVLAKHFSQILIHLGIFVLINGLYICILAIQKVFKNTGYQWESFFLILGINVLILISFSTFSVMLSSIFHKTILAVLGSLGLWFILIFLFIINPTINFLYSPVVLNNNLIQTLENTWDITYWYYFLIYGGIPFIFMGISIISMYQVDF
jgi:ABC-type transport system involved in multi-copper enzyme maturation permease subunit